MATEEIFEFDMDFDPANPGEPIDETPDFIRFVKICWLPGLSVEKVYETGVKLNFPGVTRTMYQSGQQPASTGEQFYLPILRVKAGAKNKLYTIIIRDTNQDGQEFDHVLRFKNWNEAAQQAKRDEFGLLVQENGKTVYENVKDDEGKKVLERNAFFDFQSHELEKLKVADPAGYSKLRATGQALFQKKPGAWVYVRCLIDDTGYTIGGEVRQYLKDIVIFSSEAEWKAARAALLNGNVDSADFVHYPKMWEKDPEALKTFVIQAAADNKDHKTIAAEGMMDGEAINGKPVNVKALLSELLDIPEPMINL